MTAWHESGHAASLILSGLTPLLVRVDQPTDTLLGSVKFDWTHHDPTERNLREVLIGILQGPFTDGETIDCTEWPPNFDDWSDHCREDAERIAFIIERLEGTRLTSTSRTGLPRSSHGCSRFGRCRRRSSSGSRTSGRRIRSTPTSTTRYCRAAVRARGD